jgi:hypothetical protein
VKDFPYRVSEVRRRPADTCKPLFRGIGRWDPALHSRFRMTNRLRTREFSKAGLFNSAGTQSPRLDEAPV